MNATMVNLEAMQELKDLLCATFPNEIEKVVLFGSRVNGDAREYSDYDVLVIVNHPYDWRFENKIYDTSYDIDLKYDLLADIKIISIDELNTIKGKLPFIQNALAKGVAL